MSSESAGSLRIGLLAHNTRAAGGLSVSLNLLAALGRVAPQHTYVCTIPSDCGYEEICKAIPNCEWVVCDPSSSLIGQWHFERHQLGKIVAPLRPDVLVGLGYRGLHAPPCPQALLVMDAHYFYPRKHFGPMPVRMQAAVWYNGRNLRRLMRHTQLLISQTVDAERRLAQTYDFEGRTAVIPNAVSALAIDAAGEPTLPEPLARYANRTKLLCLTQYYGHKNLEGIVTVFERFRDALDDVVVVLNIGDFSNPYARKFLASIERAELGDRIVNVGFIPQASLADYYRSCDALLMPTFLESFSGTYVEAMRYELPILTSDLDFAHAVCGDAALYFDPWDPIAIKDAILRLAAEPQLAIELAARGRARLANLFRSWDDNARDLITELTKLVV